MAGKLFIVSASSGAGKTTLVHGVLKELGCLRLSRVITYTTKTPRSGEVDGVDYHFLSTQEFEQKIAQNFFIEWSLWYGHYYGSPRSILTRMDEGESFIMIVDLPGAYSIKDLGIDAVFIWITVPSMSDLRQRLSCRNTDSQKQIEVRLALAQKEIEQVSKNDIFDYHIPNIAVKDAIARLKRAILGELGVDGCLSGE